MYFNYYYFFILFYFYFFFFWGGGVITNWTGFRGHFYAFYGLFLRSMYRMRISLRVTKISNIFFGMPDIPDKF